MRYVWLSEPQHAGEGDEVKNKMLNAILITNGHAVAKEYLPDTAYAMTFKALVDSVRVKLTGEACSKIC